MYHDQQYPHQHHFLTAKFHGFFWLQPTTSLHSSHQKLRGQQTCDAQTFGAWRFWQGILGLVLMDLKMG